MAIRLHTFITSQKRYIQIENQPHHITGIFKIIARSKSLYSCEFSDIDSAYYECEDDGTITFYQAKKIDNANPGLWTYLQYDCPEGEEEVFRDSFIDTSINPLIKLSDGQKLPQVALDIYEYLKYKYNHYEYLDIQLPAHWHNQTGREIANLLLEEFKAFKSLPIFAEGVGKEYMQAVLHGFIQAAREILAVNSTVQDFEAAQFDVLKKIQIDDTANLILDYNDYRLWQAALPSKSKAVEYAFNTALSFICRIK
ncbi:hypothetical protein [Calothrix sp. PCC 7507]|uniref:hypothetical protein n=1 Tax=Calothrix sp. PCC 7507 TaxID=99598 RepID=UPI00029ECEB2|nr:hypothetical protein [Calothrix sp. PCC 7507]AFY32258.1 hypothetical protein Cal7507_1803 [Calothrix sp. PCC 7507]